MSFFSKYATDENRWKALVFLSIGLAIVIIDNTVLNVAIPYILRDLGASLDGIQWVVSGYALIIATLLILMGRLGDIFGRKKIFIIGIALFAVGSFIASIAKSISILFIGEALIEAIGAAGMLTSSLSLLASEFRGRERAVAFGVWGSVAGASATIGPLLGGYFTTYHSWRWSLRINVIVAIIAILGSVFVKESKGETHGRFDFLGTILSGLGLFSLVFGFIEAQKYGWWHAKEALKIGNNIISFGSLSVVPVALALAVVLLAWFVWYELRFEKNGGSPVLKMSLFRNLGFSFGLLTLLIIALGQFGVFFVLPIFFQNVLGYTALKTGAVFIWSSLTVLVVGPLSGFIASKINIKNVIAVGMVFSAAGTWWLARAVGTQVTVAQLVPAFVCFGIGIGATAAQLTNLILSAAPIQFAGEASAANATIRQVGTSIGIAILGTVLASTIAANINRAIQADRIIPDVYKTAIISQINTTSVESGRSGNFLPKFGDDLLVALTVKNDVNQALTNAVKRSLDTATAFVVLGAICSFLIPRAAVAHKD